MKVNEELKEKVLLKSNRKCHYCHKLLAFSSYGKIGSRGEWHLDHRTPRAAGGSDHVSNLVAACVECNYAKSDGSPRSYRYVRREKRFERRDYAIRQDLIRMSILLIALATFGLRKIADWKRRSANSNRQSHRECIQEVSSSGKFPWIGGLAIVVGIVLIVVIIQSHKTT